MKVIIKLGVLITLGQAGIRQGHASLCKPINGLGKWCYPSMLCSSQSQAWEMTSSQEFNAANTPNIRACRSSEQYEEGEGRDFSGSVAKSYL